MPNYNEPGGGSTDWYQVYNENFADLSIDVAGAVATRGDLPAIDGTTSSSGKARSYIIEDEGALVYDDGSGWVDIGMALPSYSADGDAGDSEIFWHSGESVLKYKDGSGSIAAVLRDDSSGYLDSHLDTTQGSVHGGAYADFAAVLNVDDGPFTKDSASEVTVDESACYRLDYSCSFEENGGDSRSTVSSWVEINGTEEKERTESDCYIRQNGNDGDRGSTSNSAILDLSDGDSIRLRVQENAGGNTIDLRRASATLELLG